MSFLEEEATDLTNALHFQSTISLYVGWELFNKGARIQFVGDEGKFYIQWSQIPGCYPSTSSHKSNYTQYRIPLENGELLFSVNDLGTWCQRERNSFRFHCCSHSFDCCRSLCLGRNIGISGTSIYTESNPYIVVIHT